MYAGRGGRQLTLRDQPPAGTGWRTVCDNAVGDFLYACGTAFNVAGNQYFKDMVRTLIEHGYAPPSRRFMAEGLLTRTHDRLSKITMQKVKDAASTTGYTLVTDGMTWTQVSWS